MGKTMLSLLSRKKAVRWVLALGTVGLVAGGIGFLFPLELMEARTKVDLWWALVNEKNISGVHTYIRDECAKPQKPQDNAACACVALVHGLGDNALTWKKILDWPTERWQRMGLHGSLKLVAMDLPGAGGTAAPQDVSEYRVRKQAQKVTEILKPICHDWIVVGNSLGGWVASWIALDWPEGVSRLILLDSVGVKATSISKADLLFDPTVTSMKEFQKRAYFRPTPISDHLWDLIVAHLKRAPIRQIRAAQTEEDYLDTRLPTLRMPVLILWGQEDQVVPIAEGKVLRSLVPSAVWREVPECGHLPQKECPLTVIQGIIDLLNYGMM